MLVPSAIYAAMFFAQRFPDSERKAAGVSTAAMYGELKRPLFLVVFICMWLTAATELGPGQWVSNIFNEVMHSTLQAGVLLLVWINGIMYALRQFGGGLAHRFSPVTLVAVTAPIAAIGLWLFGRADTPVLAFAAAALLAVGTAFWWPTMLGLTSERFPRGGALALAMVGAAGAFSTAVAGPVMGWINNTYGASSVLPIWAVLPVLIALIFGILHLVDRSRGGYRIERVGA
jgi:fucose permease